MSKTRNTKTGMAERTLIVKEFCKYMDAIKDAGIGQDYAAYVTAGLCFSTLSETLETIKILEILNEFQTKALQGKQK